MSFFFSRSAREANQPQDPSVSFEVWQADFHHCWKFDSELMCLVGQPVESFGLFEFGQGNHGEGCEVELSFPQRRLCLVC